MLCALLPIVAVAVWNAQSARPRDVHYWPVSNDQRHLVAMNTLPKGTQALCTDLETGALSSRLIGQKVTSPNRESVGRFNNQVWLLNCIDNNRSEFEWVDLLSERAVITRQISRNGDEQKHYGACVVNNNIVQLKAEKLDLIDLHSGVIVDSIPLSSKGTLLLESIDDTDCFLVSEIKGNREQLLYRLDGDKIHEIARWSCSRKYKFRSASTNYIASLLMDGKTFEVRDASSGDVIAEYLVEHDPELTERRNAIDATIISRTNPRLYTDLLTGKKLPIPDGSQLIARDLEGMRLITLRKPSEQSLVWDCIVLKESTGAELSRFEVPSHRFEFKAGGYPNAFLFRANQLVLGTESYGISIYDLSTGSLVREYDHFTWPERWSLISAIGLGIWCLVWLLQSVRLHPFGWLDMFVCSGLVVFFCCNRIPYRDDTSFEACVCLGVFGCWLLTATTWLFLSRERWSVRLQPMFLMVGMTFGIAAGFMGCLTWDPSAPIAFAIGELLLIATYLFPIVLLRYLGLRIEPGDDLVVSMKPRASMFALRDLFLLTIVFALLFMVARWMPAVNWLTTTPSNWRGLLMIVSAIAVPSLVAMWTATSRRSWPARWGVLLIVIVGYEILAASLACGVFRRELVLSSAVATLFGFYAYRLRGWRLERNAIALQKDEQSHCLPNSQPLVG